MRRSRVSRRRSHREMEDRLKVYTALSRLSFPRSYQSKILLAAFLGMQLPLLGLVFYLVLASPMGFESTLGVLAVALFTTLAGTAATLYALYGLLAPLSLTSEALRSYLDRDQMPELPTDHADQAGRLMASAQYTVERLDEMIHSLGETAAKDSLTGVYNRRAAEARLVEDAARTRRGRNGFMLALVALDRLEHINHRFGRRSANVCLRHLAQILRHNLRDGDWVARWNEDEFMVGLWDLQASSAQAVLERIRDVLQEDPVRLPNGEEVYLTISGGTCQAAKGDDARRLFSEAAEALHRAQQEGGGRIIYEA
jgi:diguanylate cyclase (GGDEF)-like protein